MWSVFFVFLSYLDRNFVKCDFLHPSVDAEKDDIFYMLNSTFCTKISNIGEHYIHQVSDGIEEVRLVYDAVGTLVDCSVSGNHIQVKSFMYVCRLGFKEQRVKPGYSVGNLANIAEAKSNCQDFRVRSRIREKAPTGPRRQTTGEASNVDPGSVETGQVLHRTKRGFTYPGTLWCGAGNIADSYEHLGEFAETDKCCRVHDHCPYVIHPFSTKFGYTNFKWHSICHCDCDNALKACLRKVNDTSSRVVGQAFFNVIEVPCFEFAYEEQCVERHWYGVCKQYDKIPVAVTKESIPYDFGGIDVIDELTIAPRTQKTPNNEQEGKTESTTQPTTSGSQANMPEAPSLGNVVTAAEDFIKVLATVSSSHSSTETTKGEAQGADKKKKSKAGKKRKNQRRKGKGKGKKRRRLITTASRTEETAAALPSCPGAELVMDRNSPVILDPKPNSSVNNYVDNVLDLGSREEIPSNVTNNKSERMVEVDGHSSTTAPLNGAVKTETTEQKPQVVENQTEQISLSLRASPSTDTQFKAQKKRSKERRGKKKNIKITPGLSTIAPTLSSIIKDKAQRMTDDRAGTTAAMATAEMKPTTGTRLSTQHFPFTPTTASARTVTPLKVKRHRSKERQRGKKRRKTTPTFPTHLMAI